MATVDIILIVLASFILLGLIGYSIEGTKKFFKAVLDFIALPFKVLIHGKKALKGYKINKQIKQETKRFDKQIKEKILKIQMSHPDVVNMVSHKESKIKTLEEQRKALDKK